jgi:CheY-like chemotaxis protein
MKPSPPGRLPSKRVLVVDDEPLVAQTLRRVLLAEGHTVELAEDGVKALAILQASLPDLVITDFKLPGMDGMELAANIKKLAPSLPIILLTAYAESIERQMGKGKVSNVDRLVGKPFSIAQLQEAVKAVFPDPAS